MLKSHDYQPWLVSTVYKASNITAWNYAEVPLTLFSEFKVNNTIGNKIIVEIKKKAQIWKTCFVGIWS